MIVKSSEPIYVSKSRFGKGVFASRDIKKGELICVMRGKKITTKQLQLVTDQGRNILTDPLQIGKDKYLSLDKPYLYLNHSCQPNAGLKDNVNLLAIENIPKDEEIFYDYSTTWFDGFLCNCNNKNCRKYISDFYTIPPTQRNRYHKLGVVSNFIKKT